MHTKLRSLIRDNMDDLYPSSYKDPVDARIQHPTPCSVEMVKQLILNALDTYEQESGERRA